MSIYEEAQRIADIFRVPVGIYPTGCDDGKFRHWDWVAADKDGRLKPGHKDVVYPQRREV